MNVRGYIAELNVFLSEFLVFVHVCAWMRSVCLIQVLHVQAACMRRYSAF